MNCYDFDKTIYKKDSAISLLFFAIKQKPILFFYLFYVAVLVVLNKLKFINTKTFKEKYYKFLNKFEDKQSFIEKFWDKEFKNINNWFTKSPDVRGGGYNLIICSASPEFVVKPIIDKVCPNCLIFCTQMDINTLKIKGENLKGEEKRKILEKNGITKFKQVYTDSLSDFPLYDMAEEKYFISKSKVYKFGKQKLGFFQKIKYIIKQLRVKHYVKNGLIFVPLIFSGLLLKNNFKPLITCIFGCVAFCLSASIVYVINDLFDAKKDRNHSKKRKRPIASYMIKPYEAIIMLIVMAISICLIWLFLLDKNIWAIVIILSYITVNLLYSYWLKNLPIIDVFVLALCYVLRVYFGATIIGVGVSKWLYLTIICASLYMGYGKRRGEISQENNDTRKVINKYSYNFLDKNMYLCLTMCLIFYSLWAVDFRANTTNYFNSILILLTIPLVMFILMRYSLNIEKTNNNADPIDVLMKDYVLIIFAIIFVVLIAVSIYVPIPMVI